jgi:hypothetical protein
MRDKVTEYPAGAGVREQLKSLTYAPLPYETHPIDTTPSQQQGWGPFHGPYTPWDFESAIESQAPGGIDIFWTQGDNVGVVDYAPPYAVLTIMQDKSLDLVNNQGMVSVMAQNANAAPNTSTFSNQSRVQTTGVNPASVAQHGFFSTLAAWVRNL